MADIWHQFGSPLQINANGGLRLASGTEQGQQKIIRRLLTSPGDLLATLNYGAGLARMIGRPGNEKVIKGVIVEQMSLEPIVIQSPPPKVGVIENPGNGLYQATIIYTDNTTLETNRVQVPLSRTGA